jgi:hypothetical protein
MDIEATKSRFIVLNNINYSVDLDEIESLIRLKYYW